MSSTQTDGTPAFGSPELRLPDDLREPLKQHLRDLFDSYTNMGWARRMGFGDRPALIVIDLALAWTKPGRSVLASSVDSVVEAACRVLAAARQAGIPIFFTTSDHDPAEPPSPHDKKFLKGEGEFEESSLELDPRLERQDREKIVYKKYASAFKATNLHENLTALGVDTLIVTGVSTSHCVYATCRDATDSFNVIVPREAVGERCEIMHEVNLLDIDIDLGDVMPTDEVIVCLERCVPG